MTVRGPMISVAAGRSLGPVQWLRWRADLARPESPTSRTSGCSSPLPPL